MANKVIGCIHKFMPTEPIMLTEVLSKAINQNKEIEYQIAEEQNKIEEQNSKTKLKREFKNMVEINFLKTREKLISQDKSNTFN